MFNAILDLRYDIPYFLFKDMFYEYIYCYVDYASVCLTLIIVIK